MFWANSYEVKRELYASPATVVLGARRRVDGRQVIIKMPRAAQPTDADVATLRREYEILKSLAIPEVAQALAFELADGRAALVLEDGGAPVRVSAHTDPGRTAQFLRSASAICRALQAIHDKGVLHKDLKPQHLLCGPDGKVKIIDFGLSTKLDHEYCQWLDVDSVEGTLAYIPPEQTGRLNRPVDRRSDLYALGVSLFELVTGQLPFASQDPLELVHCHIARPAPRADSICPTVPAMVASIIEKLMAKDAEDRYQSAAGLAEDIERCLAEWEATGDITPFHLAERDLSQVLAIPQKLYGRDAALATLRDLAQATFRGAPRLALIAGPSGIGKSALIRHLQTQLPLRGRLVYGKFDRLDRSTPYGALAAACRELVRGMLSASEQHFAAKKRALYDALGSNARVIMDIIPELELILGPQPEAVPIGPVESQNRFERTFEAFLEASVTLDEPLVMFLDDLQWADPASLRLLHVLLTGQGQCCPILVIGSYRDNELFELHPLKLALAQLHKSKIEVHEIVLAPLHREDVASFLADALSRPLIEVHPLAAVLFEKTHGNPFELGQHLTVLHRADLLHADMTRHRWVWNLDAIRNMNQADSVDAVLLARLHALPSEAQRLVSFSACIGHELDIATLAVTSALSRSELVKGMEAAVREDILAPLDHGFRDLQVGSANTPVAVDGRYRFVHDRLRQAAYTLLTPAERARVHLKIGEHLRKELGEHASDEELFATAHQMNLGLAHIQGENDRRWLAELNLKCGRKAQATAAIPQALGFLDQVFALLGETGWSDNYATVCSATLAKAECEYLRGENARALALLDEIDGRATEVLHKLASRNLRTMVLVHLGRMLDGCINSLAALRLLGVDLPDPSAVEQIGERIGAEFAALQPELAALSFDALPEMANPLKMAELQTIVHAIPAAFQSVPPLMVLMVVKGTRLSLRHGASDLLPFILVQYAIAHLAITGDHVAAYRLGKLGIDLGLRRQNASALGSAYFLVASLLAPWCEPIGHTLDLFDVGLRRCLDSGDLMYAVYCAMLASFHRLLAGRPLAEVRAAIPAARALAERAGDMPNQMNLVQCERLAAVLAGEGEIPGSLNGNGFDEDEFATKAPVTSHAWLRWSQAMVRFHAGMYGEALAAATASEVSVGLACLADLALYAGLSHAALARTSQGDERERHIEHLVQKTALFAKWVATCPANFAHGEALLAAELADLRGDVLSAMEAYDKAIAGAQENAFLQHQSLACELCGDFYLRRRHTKIARTYLQDALHAYQAWGAAGKARQLHDRHPELALLVAADEESHSTPSVSTAITNKRSVSGSTRGVSLALDMESAMRASHAIASELGADKLIDRLMRILVENAGAQRGVLVVPRPDDLYVEAERTVSPDEVTLRIGKAVAHAVVPERMIRYVARTHESVVWDGRGGEGMSFSDENYLLVHPPRSALCVPLLHQGQLNAVLYLENRSLAHGFNPARISRIQFLAAQAAAALENSRLYEEVQAARRDLEERVRARTSELQQRNTDLRNVLDTVDQGLVAIDRGAILTGESSSRAIAWFGPLESGRSWIDVLAGIDPAYAREFQAFFDQLAQGRAPAGARQRLPRRLVLDQRTLEIDLAPVGGEDSWKRMLVVASDITDRERQARLEMELRQAQKLQAVGQLAAGIAHEINTPAQFVGDSVEFLAGVCEQTLDLVSKYRDAVRSTGNQDLVQTMRQADEAADMAYTEENAPGALASARDGVSRIATIVSAMKEFAHPESREKSMADLNRALETTLTIACNEYKYVADVETAFEPLPLVPCHVGDLNQVFLNLIVNAAHAISDVVGKTGNRGRIVVRTFNEGDGVRVEIADTGCGIRPEIRDRVFDPFFTTKEVGRGSGQGLAIARNIVVDKHGGTLRFESDVGKGTTFIIVIPVKGRAG